jgi:hypothetical protein
VLGSFTRTSALGYIELLTQSRKLAFGALELLAKALKVLVTRAELNPRPLASSLELSLDLATLDRDRLQLALDLT